MTRKKIVQEINACIDRVSIEIADTANHGHIAAGLSSEGWVGGYLAALEDCLLLLGGIDPGNNRRFWEDWRRDRQKPTAIGTFREGNL